MSYYYYKAAMEHASVRDDDGTKAVGEEVTSTYYHTFPV